MTYRTLIHALTLVGLTVATTVAAADEEALRRMRIDLRAGALVAGTDPSVTIDGEKRHAQSDSGLAVGVGAGYALTDHFDLAVDADSNADGNAFDLFGSSTNATYNSVSAGARYYPIGRRRAVRPWLIGQAGWYRGHAIASENALFHRTTRSVTDNGGGLNVGAGFDVPVGRLVSLGAGLRYNKTLGVFDDPSYLTTMAQLSFHFWK